MGNFYRKLKSLSQLESLARRAANDLTFGDELPPALVVVFLVLDEAAVPQLSGDVGQVAAVRHLAVRNGAERQAAAHLGHLLVPVVRRQRALVRRPPLLALMVLPVVR